jgi:hypothetical protein
LRSEADASTTGAGESFVISGFRAREFSCSSNICDPQIISEL